MPDLRKLYILTVILGVGSPVAGHADQKSDDIARLMVIGGGSVSAAESRLTTSLAPIMQRFADAHPNIPPDALATLHAEVHQQAEKIFNVIIQQAQARYYADLTEDEVRAILAFYGTPAGQAAVRENNVVSTMVTTDMTLMFPTLLKQIVADFAAALRQQTPPPQPG